MGTIEKVAGGYCIHWKDGGGSPRQKTLDIPKKRAKELLDEIEYQVVLARAKNINRVLFNDFAHDFLVIYARPTFKPSSYDRTAGVIQDHLLPYFGNEESVDEITVKQCQSYVATRIRQGAAPSTVDREIGILKIMLSFALTNHNCSENVALKVRSPQPRPTNTRSLEPEEVVRLLQEIPGNYRLFFALLVMTGLRVGEAIALTWEDIDFKNLKINVNKTVYKQKIQLPKTKKSIRRVDMPPALAIALAREKAKRQASENELVFMTTTGSYFDYHNVSHRVFNPAVERAKLGHVRIHDLRHTYASLLLDQGASLEYIQEMLGHESLATTIRYLHLLPSAHTNEAEKLEKTMFGDKTTNEIVDFL